MKKQDFKNVYLSEISANPHSPRKSFMGPRFDELVDSIREKGVIEPIIIRPKSNGNTEYEVVAGDRRFKAACQIAESDNGLEKHKIPAIIRDLSDDEAFDFMIIENLQREDLTSYEEAWGFKKYCDKKGKGSVVELAKRIGKSPGYIRRKIAVLSLPKYAVNAWEKEELPFSHLEQLRRLKNTKDLKEAFEYAIGGQWREGPVSKRELKEHIDEFAPSLKNAFFDLEKEGCLRCDQNSDVQQKLWEIGSMKGAHCLDKKCFKQKQNNFLLSNWKISKYCRQFGTNGFRFDEDLSWGDYKSFTDYSTQPEAKCNDCHSFLTIIHVDGKISTEKACFGDKNCYGAIGRQQKQEEKKEEKKDGPRIPWHGEYFRERFFEERIPQIFEQFKPEDLKMAHLVVFSFLKLDRNLLEDFAKKHKQKQNRDYYYRYNEIKILELIKKMDHEDILEFLKEAALKIIMDKCSVHAEGRLAAANHLGIDLQKEWAATEEYLQKKTIKEMLKFGEISGIFKDKKVQKFLVEKLKKKPGKYSSCKKIELIQIFLKSGVELRGKVPDEIIKINGVLYKTMISESLKTSGGSKKNKVMKCPYCKSIILRGVRVCPSCGQECN